MDERLRKEDWEVRPVGMDVGRRLVRKFHYAKGAANTCVYVHGLFRKGAFFDEECLGIALWMPPIKAAAVATYPENWRGVLALSRLVIDPIVPRNACSFLIARSAKLIPAKEWPCLLTYADEWQGHTGAIYKASNWTYCGTTVARERFTVAGVMTCVKAGPKTRSREDMLRLGAVSMGKHRKHKFVLIRA